MFREMTLVICSGDCLQECELIEALECPGGAKMVGFIYILYETFSRAADPMCLTVWPNMCKIFANLLHDAIGVIKCCLLCGA